MPYDKVGSITYMFCLTVINVTSCYKGAVSINTTLDILNMDENKFTLEGILTSVIITDAFIKLFNNQNNLFRLNKVKTVITDRGSEFKKNFDIYLQEHEIFHQIAKSKETIGIIERFNRTLAEKLFRIQDTHELLLPLPKRSRIWVKNLSIVLKDLNNSITRLLGITPNKAVLKKIVYAKALKPRYGPMGFDKVRLKYNDSVLYLLKAGELEGGKKRATDCNWSPQIYQIKESLVQKNQPVLY